jgi:diguanylate cyclase (GGDEF)-like protein/PAS domain S-box-containing protein
MIELNKLIENINDLVFVCEESQNKTKIVYANKTAQNKLMYSLEEMNDINICNFEQSKKVYLTKKNGEEFPAEVSSTFINHENKFYNVLIIRDITKRFNYEQELKYEIELKTKELSENIHQLQSYKEAVDINSIITISDPNGRIKYANDKFYEISGFTKEEIIGKNHNIIRHPDVDKQVFEDMWNTILSKKIWKGELKNLTKDGKTYIVHSVIVPVLDDDNGIREFIATRYEITDITNKQDKIEQLLKTDALTGLYNRFYLNETIQKLNNEASIALIDINRFHEINDFYGDTIGDMIIIKLSKILKNMLDNDYMLFHLSGDEFIVFNTNKSKNIFINDMRKINEFLNTEKLIINDKKFYLNTNISLSFEDKHTLISSVHLAKTYAKQNGYNFSIYSKDNPLEKEYQSNLKWSSDIRKAIHDDRITVFFQPIVDAKTKEIIKYESLVRMIDEEGKVISPYFFLDKAKKSNQYTQITKIILDKTLETILINDIKASINITLEDINSQDVKNYIYKKLDEFYKCENITFELVESEGIENFEDVENFIKTIKSYGCKLAIDDFGTGYSNFEYLLKLNTDIIKIDGSLIKEIDKNQDHFDIVKTIVSFAKTKNLKVVAEFVSSEEINQKILELDIDYAQGYLFSEPKPMI